MTREWSLAEVHDVVSSAVPERDMIVWGDDRRTYGEIAERSRAFAKFLHSRQLGAFRDRGDLARWECGQESPAYPASLRDVLNALQDCAYALRGRAGRGSLVVADGVVDIADAQSGELPSDPMEPLRRWSDLADAR